jgi:hypothetical protein
MIVDIIDYLTLKYLTDKSFEAPVGRKMKVAFLMAKKRYNEMSIEERRKIEDHIRKRS